MKLKYLILFFFVFTKISSASKLIRDLSNENTAIENNSSSIWHNPAGIGFIDNNEIGISYKINNFSSQIKNYLFNTDATLQINKSVNIGLGFNSLYNSLFADNSLVIGITHQSSNNLGLGLSIFRKLKKNNDFLFSLGIINRPLNWLSWSALYQETHNGYFSSPNIILGIAFKPMGDIFTLGIDNKFLSSSNKWKDGFRYQPNIGLQTQFEGFNIKTNIEMPYKSYKNLIFSASINFNFNYVGLGFSGSTNMNKNYILGANIRLSDKKYASIIKEKNQWVSLDLNSKGYRANNNENILQKTFNSNLPEPLEVIDSLGQLAKDDSIEGIFLRIRGFDIAHAQALEWRSSLLKLKKHNKKIIIHLASSSEIDYFIASIADTILMDPNATIDFNGFSSHLINIAKPLKLIGIKADATVSGKYKNAPNFFTHEKPSEEEINVKTNIVKNFYEDTVNEISLSRNINKKTLKNLFDKGEITAKEAYDFKLVDKLLFSEDSKNYIKENFSNNIDFYNSYEAAATKISSWKKKYNFAVIPLYGSIVAGRVTPKIISLFNERQTGSEDFIDSLNEAIKNPTIEGILLHINSPGGTFDGSHEIYRAIKNASSIKPIVVSMSDVAASGAYQAALGSQYIFANRNTLTGSVGVYSLSFEASKLANLLGINNKEISMIKNSRHNLLASMSKEEKINRQQIVDWHYDIFVSLMADNMNINKNTAFNIAQGRVWLGYEALNNGMIHKIGGFNDAVNKLKELTLCQSNQPYSLVFVNPNNKGLDLINMNFFAKSLYEEIKNLSKVQAKLNF